MFTGLVEAIGRLAERSSRGSGARVRFDVAFGPLVLGESVAVDGACLTVSRVVSGGFEADLSGETLARTTLGRLAVGARVHMERATAVGGRLGGHMVLGHVDGVGTIASATKSGEALRLEVRAPRELAAFVAEKGSIAVLGVSLTVNGVRDSASEVSFDMMLVPHTLGETKLGELRVGDAVNLEVDVLARYVQRALRVGVVPAPLRPESHESYGDASSDDRFLAKLRENGFA